MAISTSYFFRIIRYAWFQFSTLNLQMFTMAKSWCLCQVIRYCWTALIQKHHHQYEVWKGSVHVILFMVRSFEGLFVWTSMGYLSTSFRFAEEFIRNTCQEFSVGFGSVFKQLIACSNIYCIWRKQLIFSIAVDTNSMLSYGIQWCSTMTNANLKWNRAFFSGTKMDL